MIALDELLLFLYFAFDDNTIDDERNTHTRLECCTENLLDKMQKKIKCLRNLHNPVDTGHMSHVFI